MPIYSLKDGIFDSEATALLGKAFEAACEELHFPKDKSVREFVAKRVIAAARRGELDPLRLSAAAVGMSHRDAAAMTNDRDTRQTIAAELGHASTLKAV